IGSLPSAKPRTALMDSLASGFTFPSLGFVFMPENPTFPTVSGKWVILVMVGLGVLAAGFAGYYRHSFTRRALAYWGGREANAITTAPTVTLLDLMATDASHEGEDNAAGEAATPADANETFVWIARTYRPVRQFDLSKAGGLAHAREALVL